MKQKKKKKHWHFYHHGKQASIIQYMLICYTFAACTLHFMLHYVHAAFQKKFKCSKKNRKQKMPKHSQTMSYIMWWLWYFEYCLLLLLLIRVTPSNAMAAALAESKQASTSQHLTL